MSEIHATSVSLSLLPFLYGPLRRGRGLGHGYVDVDGYVVAFTRPGAPRMPNGIECGEIPWRGDRVRIGAGRVRVRGTTIVPGPVWDPVPRVLARPCRRRDVAPRVTTLAGRGEGLTPSGDDLLLGYVAGLVLFRRSRQLARHIAESAARRTTSLSATLLRHAARGEVPEPVHALLERGDAAPLGRWGASSGRELLHGLELAA